jgi:hypothetical protein
MPTPVRSAWLRSQYGKENDCDITCPKRGSDYSWHDFSVRLPAAANKRNGATSQSRTRNLLAARAPADQQEIRAAGIHFSWKPELFTRSDESLFESRLCRHPPDILYVDKGYHDVCFLRPNATTAEHQLRMFGALLRCLPPTSLVIIRAPAYARPGDRVCDRGLRTTSIPKLLDAMRSLYLQLHAEGAFGPALLIDGYLLGSTTLTAKRAEPDPEWQGDLIVDRHHHGWPPKTAPSIPPFLFNPGFVA